MNARRVRLTIAVLAACAAVAAPAQAAPPDQTLTGISGSYDVAAGAVRATATLAAPPAADAFLAVYVGQWSGTSCQSKALLATTTADPDPSGLWTLIGGDGSQYPTQPRERSGASVTIAVADPQLANQAYDCVWASTAARTDSNLEYSRVAAVDLTVTAPPPPAPGPTPTPPPSPEPAGKPVAVPKAAKLAITVDGAPPLRRNRWARVQVEVANVGGKAAKRVTLQAQPGRGATVSKRKLRVGTIAPGKKRTVRLRLRTQRKSDVRLVARSGKLTARKRLPLVLRGKAKPPSAEGLAGQYFTHWSEEVLGQSERIGYAFVDGRWAYRGIPEGGLPTCTTKTAGTDADGDPTDGCLPYTYDKKTRELKIDGQPASLAPDGGTLKIGEDTLWLTPIVAPGTRLTVSLKSITVTGLWPNQVVTTRWLDMTANGEFALSSQTLGSWGTPGAPGSGNFASVPPDQKGTYEVLPRGKLRLHYADGDVVDKTIGIYRDAETGSADPAKDGLWLDDEPYWLDDIE